MLVLFFLVGLFAFKRFCFSLEDASALFTFIAYDTSFSID